MGGGGGSGGSGGLGGCGGSGGSGGLGGSGGCGFAINIAFPLLNHPPEILSQKYYERMRPAWRTVLR